MSKFVQMFSLIFNNLVKNVLEEVRYGKELNVRKLVSYIFNVLQKVFQS